MHGSLRMPGRRQALGTATAALAAALLPPVVVRGAEQGPPVLRGYSGQFTRLTPARIANTTPLATSAGETVDLTRFRGKVVLLNFWATWCAPCVYEMPSLDRLAGEQRRGLAIIPVAIDTGPVENVVAFYDRHGLRHLAIYIDPKQQTGYRHADNPNDAAFALYGLPITYVIDHDGYVMGYITGAVDWQSDAAAALLVHYTARIRA